MEDVVIKARLNGPYKVTGKIQLVDYEGNSYEVTGNFVLCRCGHSSNKPFCDGTHTKVNFQATETASLRTSDGSA